MRFAGTGELGEAGPNNKGAGEADNMLSDN
jgi:hypothetical protein